MLQEKRHQAWLKFIRDITSITAGLSMRDLLKFRDLAMKDYPTLYPIVVEYLRLAQRSEVLITIKKKAIARGKPKEVHLFDLLREKAFFPRNLDLATFASRVVPNMSTYRFDKMSRSDIAARIIEHLENSDFRTREALEESMRDALAEMKKRPAKDVERQSFLSKWERIIKGLEL